MNFFLIVTLEVNNPLKFTIDVCYAMRNNVMKKSLIEKEEILYVGHLKPLTMALRQYLPLVDRFNTSIPRIV